MLEPALMALFVALAGFFSGTETGFYSLNRMRLRFRLRRGWRSARHLQELLARPELAISTVLIGTNITVYLATVLCAKKLGELGLADRADLYSSLIMPPLLLVFAEIVPKSLFRYRADTLMYRAAGALKACAVVFAPVLVVLRGMVFVLKRLVGRESQPAADVFTAERFRFYLSEGAAIGLLSPYQQAMANNVLRVKSLGLRSAMVPLERVVMISEDASREELNELLRNHRFSRIPVYSGRRDNITGTVNVIDLMCAEPDTPVRPLTRHCLSLDARLSVAEALYALQRAHQQMAVVTAHDGAAVGIVTVKDLVEEIVGELRAW